LVHRYQAQLKVPKILENGDLYAEPHHGERLRYVVLHDFWDAGPVMNTLVEWGWLGEGFDISFVFQLDPRIIAFLNFLMWFGNTTLLLMAGVMGIDNSIYESALLDGASSGVFFRKITMPLLRPIFIYVLITSMIGGIQLFDVAQIFTQTSSGGPKPRATP
jgi:cellobiose transport system permease protein